MKRFCWNTALALVLGAVNCLGVPQILTPTEAAREFEQRTWTQEQGLPDNRVNSLLQTHDGYLWIGTQKGLARFDGFKFTVFDRANTPALFADDCRELAEDTDGNLWINTRKALVRKTGEHFVALTKRDGLREDDILSLSRSSGGGVWSGGSRGMSLIRGNTISNYYNSEIGSIVLIQEESADEVWVGTRLGLFRFEPKQGRFERRPMHSEFEQLPVLQMVPGASGRRWVMFGEQGPPPFFVGSRGWLACFQKGEWIRRPNPAKEDFTLHGTFLAEDSRGTVWLPAGGKGLRRFSRGGFDFVPMMHMGETDFPLCVLSDREGNLWIGTSASGLQRWAPRKLVTLCGSDGLADDNVWTACQGRDGAFWIGTDNGISRLKDEAFTNFGTKEGLTRKEVRGLAEDQAGRLWIGTMSGLFTLSDGKCSKYDLQGAWTEGKVRTILAARDGSVWVGTVNGLNHLKAGERTKYGVTNGLACPDVRALMEDHEGDLWVGTAGGGLQCLHKEHFTTISTSNGLSSALVWALCEDKSGAIWAGTEHGLNRVVKGKVTAYTTRAGLPDDEVNCILEDDFGRLWISHDHGIYWVRLDELEAVAARRSDQVRCTSYHEEDGLLSVETNGQKSNPAGWKSSDGRLCFAGTKGLVLVDPTKVEQDAVAPLTAIEQVRTSGRLLLDSNPASSLPAEREKVRMGVNGSFHLSAGMGRVLEFRYTANTFVAPEKARFKYRLLGLDEHWIDVGTRREAYFTNLRPGDYQFEVIACNHHGVWQEGGATVGLHLAPFVYQTWWFYLGCGLTVGALLTMGIGWRVRELRNIHRLEQANALSEQRKQIARDIHDELGASLTHILQLSGETRAKVTQPEQVEARTKQIATIAEEAVDHIGEIVWANNPEYDTLEDLVAYLREYTARFFAASSIRVQFDFPDEVQRKQVTGLFRRHLLLVVKEALQNVMKHAEARQVWIKLAVQASRLELWIRDDGAGLGDSGAAKPGNGLVNMRHRVTQLNGDFKMESQPGKGTEIRISVPLS